jgi:sec-independent protein translocase protein TatB
MFDFGFWELVVVGAVALIVFGPERLPQFARRAGYWLGRARRQIQEVRAEIEREMALDEMQRAKRKIETPLHDLADDIRGVSSFRVAEDKSAAGTKTETAKPSDT